jgi:hypothetical protein
LSARCQPQGNKGGKKNKMFHKIICDLEMLLSWSPAK